MQKIITELGQVLVAGSLEKSIQYTSTRIQEELIKALEDKDFASIALAGGRTPQKIYEAWSLEKDFPFDKIKFFFGDERAVGPEDKDNNYRMAMEAFSQKIENTKVFRMQAEESLKENALAYEKILEQELKNKALDLCLLGLGTDGHIASLFPASAALGEESCFVRENYAPSLDTWRMTLTFPALFKAKKIFICVFGAEKALIIKDALENKDAELPVQKLAPVHEKLTFFLDDAAAKELLF